MIASPLLEWAVAARPLPGQAKSGDLHVVREFPGGVLVAVVDGLGHGDEAAAAAEIAVATLRAYADESVVALVQRCHSRLRHTRGAVMSLASFEAAHDTMTWLGIGNVEGVLFRADPHGGRVRESVPQRGGIVGESLPALRPAVLSVEPGDTLILATDGISSRFAEGLSLSASPEAAAGQILAAHAKTNDDALVLVARYLGSMA